VGGNRCAFVAVVAGAKCENSQYTYKENVPRLKAVLRTVNGEDKVVVCCMTCFDSLVLKVAQCSGYKEVDVSWDARHPCRVREPC
jgi:hypothetical protein